MNWKLKAAAHWALSLVPPLYRTHKYRTASVTVTPAMRRLHEMHVKNFAGGRAVEIGAGQNLLSPILLSQAGASEVLAFDVERLARIETVNQVLEQLALERVRDFEELAARYRIRYLAPRDFRRSGLDAGSVDFICSTDTFEHIPRQALAEILAECRRIASPRCVMSHAVDYRDHYTDTGTATLFNFYRFGDAAWRKWNPPTHYQNRLRHSDIVEMLAGWRVEAQTHEADVIEPVHEELARYSLADLRTWRAYITAHDVK